MRHRGELMGTAEKDASSKRCNAPSVQDYLNQESRDVPEVLRQVHWQDMGSKDLAKERYLSREFHDLEMARVWRKVWQMACREEDIPNVGDHIIYEIGDDSLIVVRVAGKEIRAFHNACLHRGRKLRDEAGCVQQFRCPFHAFTWALDGALKSVPCRWDFPHIKDKEFTLPEARAATWSGFVFINMDPDCVSLEEYLAFLPEHFTRWNYDERYKIAHVGKIVPANWKVTQEAFMESFHVIATHPQIMPSTADANSQYDIFEDQPHLNRMITSMGVPSPHLGEDYPDEKILQSMMKEYGGAAGANVKVSLPKGQTTRQFMAQMARNMVTMSSGRDISHATDSEMLDAIQYFVFPNFLPWGGFFQNIVYRFRPNGNDPDSALMEVMLLALAPKNKPTPKPVPYHFLEADEPWTNATELGLLGAVFEQDMSNLPFVQQGLKAMHKPGVTLGNYQESRIRHFHQTLDQYIFGKDAGEK